MNYKGIYNVFSNKKFHLPLRWDGVDFETTLNELFKTYIQTLKDNIEDTGLIKKVEVICLDIKKVISMYFKGFPYISYMEMDPLMQALMSDPLNIYQDKDWTMPFEETKSSLKLYRMVNVKDIKNYRRTRVFHTPYTLRHKIPTSRYSIAGFPSLYLSTDLELCYEELGGKLELSHYLASRYEILPLDGKQIKILELGVKPQDFYENRPINRKINKQLLTSNDVHRQYILWYPLIAASSFSRANKKDPFAAEYILPQLLMQWIKKHSLGKIFYGIRYFSCASLNASNLGFNYIFPTSGDYFDNTHPYCNVLGRMFKLTNPIYLHDYKDIIECQGILNEDVEIDYFYK